MLGEPARNVGRSLLAIIPFVCQRVLEEFVVVTRPGLFVAAR